MTDDVGFRGLTRRELLRTGAGGLALTASLTACDALSTDPQDSGRGSGDADAENGREAPTLAGAVEDGTLPRVEERLPSAPLVVEPVERSGVYGGTWRTAVYGTADRSWLYRTVGFENLTAWRYSSDWTGSRDDVIPNLAESWEVNDAATEFVFTLREGIKWSDGKPFTADDIVFAQNEVLNNEELFPTQLNPGTAEAVDEYTVRITLEQPNGLFLQLQPQRAGERLAGVPRHYMKQFHPDHNADVDALVAEEGYEDWVALFHAKLDRWENLDLPVLCAWRTTTPLSDGTRVTVERNPFYWKTDPDGRQLPYIDEIVYEVVSDLEVLTLKATSGEIDFHTRHINTLQNKPVLAKAREQAGFDFMRLISSAPSNTMLIMLNLAHRDPVKREIFNNIDFRIGLSHAINRQEIIDVTLQGQGTPAQHGPRPESRFHNEELFTQYVAYDVALANEHLDRAGYTATNDDGVRLGPDGNPIRFTVDVTEIFGQPWVEMLELVKGYWREVGVLMDVRNMDRSLHGERATANQHDAQVWEGQGGLDVLIRPGDFVPINPSQARYARLWADWYASGGEAGEEPPGSTKEQFELYDQLLGTFVEEEQETFLRQILDMAVDEFYSIGISLQPESYGIVKDNFHNVPPVLVESFLHNTPGSANPCQFFIDDE